MVDLQQRLGIKLTHVPYKGGSELYNGLMGSQIDAIADASGWIPLVQSGKFRLLVVWGSRRMPLFPEVRTLKDAGIDLEVNSPYGVCGPKGMDPAIVKKIHDAMKDALFDPATQAVMNTYNMPTLYLDTAAYDKAARAAGRDRARQPQARRHAGEAVADESRGDRVAADRFCRVVGMDTCHIAADKANRPNGRPVLAVHAAVSIGGIVLGLLLGFVDILRKVRAKRDKH